MAEYDFEVIKQQLMSDGHFNEDVWKKLSKKAKTDTELGKVLFSFASYVRRNYSRNFSTVKVKLFNSLSNILLENQDLIENATEFMLQGNTELLAEIARQNPNLAKELSVKVKNGLMAKSYSSQKADIIISDGLMMSFDGNFNEDVWENLSKEAKTDTELGKVLFPLASDVLRNRFRNYDKVSVKVKLFNSLSDTLLENQDLIESATEFMLQGNTELLAVIARQNPNLAKELSVRVKKGLMAKRYSSQEADANILDKLSIDQNIAEHISGFYQSKLQSQENSSEVEKLKKYEKIAKRRLRNAQITDSEAGIIKYKGVLASVQKDIQEIEQEQFETRARYRKDIDIISKGRNSFAAFLVDSMASGRDVLSKKEFISFYGWPLEDSYVSNDYSGGCSRLVRHISFYEKGYAHMLAVGASELVAKRILPGNINALSNDEIYDIIKSRYGVDFHFNGDLAVCKHLAVKYSEWLLQRNKPGFSLMDDFLPNYEHFYFSGESIETNCRENARAILKTLRTAEEIQKWGKQFDKEPMEALSRIPELKVDPEDSSRQIFVPLSAALQYAQYREKYFPDQTVDECLQKQDYPKEYFDCGSAGSYFDFNEFFVTEFLYKVLDKEPSNSHQKTKHHSIRRKGVLGQEL